MKKLTLILLIIMVILFTSGCSQNATNVCVVERTRFNADDVVSPDGVHYWLYHNGHGGQLVPRFGSDGRIMVDNEN